MTPADLTPENIGKGYLADILEASPTNLPDELPLKPVKWYQFRIPVREYQKA